MRFWIKIYLALLLCLTCTAGIAQENSAKTSRKDFKLTLAVDEDNFYESNIQAGPYIVGPDVLQIYPGENVFMEVEQEHGVIKSLKVVTENKNPAKTVEISFKQNTEGRKHQTMMLTIKNPFDVSLKYRASIFLMKQDKWKPTSVMPVMAGISSNEMWPDIIVTIALDQWQFSPDLNGKKNK